MINCATVTISGIVEIIRNVTFLVNDSFVLQVTGFINGIGNGCASNQSGNGAECQNQTESSAGAPHGGTTFKGGNAYGSYRMPVTMGSASLSSNGGAAIQIHATSVRIDGHVDTSASNSTGQGFRVSISCAQVEMRYNPLFII